METTIKSNPAKKIQNENDHLLNGHSVSKRLTIQKTYKLYIDGKFPRTESGRYQKFADTNENHLANICRASRKDLRDSIVSNRKAQPDWSKKTAYNKGQILYRIAETLESRKEQFVALMIQQGYKSAEANKEIVNAIDTLVYYAGWSDKYMQVFSSVNPVESSHFNFSYPEATGVAGIIAENNSGLIGLINAIAPVIVGGNTCTVLSSEYFPLTAIDFAEVLNASDVPGGVVNILTGQRKELIGHFSSHMDINAIVYSDLEESQIKTVQTNAALNVKRVIDFSSEERLSPYRIMACQEIKTTWHPVGI